MGRLKTFRGYLISFLIFYCFVSFMSYFMVKSTLNEIVNYTILCNDVDVEITRAKASNVNGTIKGTVKNITKSKFKNKYLKIELQSKEGNSVTKYVDISNLEKNKSKEFMLNFKVDKVASFIVDDVEEGEIDKNIFDDLDMRQIARMGLAGMFLALMFGL